MTGLSLTDGKFQGIGKDGKVVGLGSLEITHSATGLPAITYRDSEKTSANTQPILLSASGKADVYLIDGTYDIVLKDQYGEVVWSVEKYISNLSDVYTKSETYNKEEIDALPSIVNSEWVIPPFSVVYKSSTSFTIIADKTSIFMMGRKLKINLGSTSVYSEVLSSSYDSDNDITTVITKNAVVTSTLTSVDYSILTPYKSGGGSSPYISGVDNIIVSNVSDLTNINTAEYKTAYVKDLNKGGMFIAKTGGTVNNCTIFQGSGGYNWHREYSGAIQANWAGVVANDGTDQTSLINNAYSVAYLSTKRLVLPSGTIKANLSLDKNVSIYGQGKGVTILTPFDENAECLKLTSTDNFLINVEYKDFSIIGNTTTPKSKGLVLGDGTNGLGILHKSTLQNIEVKYFATNIYHQAVIGCTFIGITSEYATDSGIEFPYVRPNTTNTYINMTIRQNRIGITLNSLMISSFTSCIIESNKETGILDTGSTTNTATGLVFNTCWFENNGHTPAGATTDATLYFDFNSSVGDAYSSNFTFNNCVFSSPTGIPDIYSVRGNNIFLNSCYLTDLTSDNLKFSAGVGITQIYLNNCSKYKQKATKAMYASFPALSGVYPNYRGFKYTFRDEEGITHTNIIDEKYTTLTSGGTIDVSEIETIYCDTTSGDIVLDSFTNAHQGKRLTIVHNLDTTNKVTVKYNTGGADGVYFQDAVDHDLQHRESLELIKVDYGWMHINK